MKSTENAATTCPIVESIKEFQYFDVVDDDFILMAYVFLSQSCLCFFTPD